MEVDTNSVQQIKTEAKRLGFLQIGFSQANPPQQFDRFQNWINKGFHGSMKYLQRQDLVEKRKNPKQLLNAAKSIISLAYPYAAIIPNESKGKNLIDGSVASFALMEDYHIALQKKAELLCSFISTLLRKECKYKICIDSSPILERELAVQCGIGWIGKNANLISLINGSYILLCEILIDNIFPYSSSFGMDYCGKCTRCLEACPTRCIQPDRTIDARYCISYLTIENPSEIPVNLRKEIGNWIFGCDVCQLVCPWNQKIITKPTSDHSKLIYSLANVNLLEEIFLTKEGFENKYKKTTIIHTKFLSYKRNLIIAMGNSRNPNFIPILQNILSDRILHSYVCWAIERISG